MIPRLRPVNLPVSRFWQGARMRTDAQLTGDEAEARIAADLQRQGWQILGSRLRVGRAELDLLAIDPGPPAMLVAVEVRWRGRRDYGLPEETVDRRKVRRLQQALLRLRAAGFLPGGRALPGLPFRLDIVALEGRGEGPPAIRHHRAVSA